MNTRTLWGIPVAAAVGAAGMALFPAASVNAETGKITNVTWTTLAEQCDDNGEVLVQFTNGGNKYRRVEAQALGLSVELPGQGDTGQLALPPDVSVTITVFNTAQSGQDNQDGDVITVGCTPVPVTVPDTVPDTVPETIPDTVPDTLPETIPDTLPETIPDTLPDTVPELTLEGLPESEVQPAAATAPDPAPKAAPEVLGTTASRPSAPAETV